MEEEKIFECPPGFNWQSSVVVSGSLPADQIQSGFLHLNWDSSMDHSAAQFESALSSMVSSPSNPTPPPPDSVVIRELIGRLGSICHAGEISPQSHQYMGGGGGGVGNNSANTSCYSTPLNSPPKLNLSMMDHHLTRVGGGGVPIQGNPAVPPLPTHLAPFAADPEFAERAARFSCFGSRGYGGGLGVQFGLLEPGKLSRVPSSQSLKAGGLQMSTPDNTKEIAPQDGSQPEGDLRSKFGSRLSTSSTPDDADFGSVREESTASQQPVNSVETAAGSRGPIDGNARKRKAASKGKAKDIPQSPSIKDPPKMAEEDDSNAKRCKSAEANGTAKDDVKPKVEQESNSNNGDSSGLKQGKENSSKPPEAPKQDYIHVRARRGQATDSHSLAERVRREKISQRMKFLQDLVPGCNKVTGKALMLDEIINYVQSLQRQVEFLSMKLATVNPRLDFNAESLLAKDMHQSRGSLPHSVYPLEASASAFPYAQQTPQQGTPLQSMVSNGPESQCPVNPLDTTPRRTLSMQMLSMDGFVDAASQIGAFWEDDLQSVVQMGFGQNQEAEFSSQSFHGSVPTNHMKIEP
ncbi:hypothetical protein Taro_004876 [Colocasia esculenta]|uniref:BHLH domain-containing protein n=1 Tax=Colocasia esculenta TaxID=4460 RepID=A0A843TSX8_COLES|nr:hypothetical protein [Colocasia esculenta]